MVLRALAGTLLLVAAAPAAAQGLYDDINRLRAGGGCASAGKLAPLVPQPALEQAARALAGGANLKDSLKDAGYRSTRSAVFNIHGDGVGEQAGAILAKYCAQLTDAAVAEVGVYRDARQLWVVTAAPFAPRVALAAEAAGQRVLELVNQARAEPRTCGDKAFKAAGPLRWNETLARASLGHASDMARQNYFSHDGRDGSKPADRVTRSGYKYRTTGENIAAGQSTPEDAVAGWIKSPPHCANLMNPAYAEMGVAFAVEVKSDMGIYWTQLFGTPR